MVMLHLLYDIAQQAKAKTVGIGIVVEKSFQDGRQRLEEAGLNVSSLCKSGFIKRKPSYTTR